MVLGVIGMDPGSQLGGEVACFGYLWRIEFRGNPLNLTMCNIRSFMVRHS